MKIIIPIDGTLSTRRTSSDDPSAHERYSPRQVLRAPIQGLTHSFGAQALPACAHAWVLCRDHPHICARKALGQELKSGATLA